MSDRPLHNCCYTPAAWLAANPGKRPRNERFARYVCDGEPEPPILTEVVAGFDIPAFLKRQAD